MRKSIARELGGFAVILGGFVAWAAGVVTAVSADQWLAVSLILGGPVVSLVGIAIARYDPEPPPGNDAVRDAVRAAVAEQSSGVAPSRPIR